MNKFYITTAIDYVNDTIHIGHAFQKLAADVLARYYRIKLGEENVFFLTGTDEYGHKAQKAAEKAGVPVKKFVDRISKLDQEQQNSLNISYNKFIRTTDQEHFKVVQEIWKRADRNGDIYLSEYSGLYCEGCEAYYNNEDLVDGKCCPYHPTLEIKKITEKNYFFKWSKYKGFLENHLKSHPQFVIPESRRNEMLEFVKSIKDIPISRASFSWGIPVPNDPEQVIYVWFDALINYLTGIGFLEKPEIFKKFWPADIHILGKDNVRWHALLWPAILKSSGVQLPKTILVNGFLSLNGQKISKSLGNIIRPSDWVKKYGSDGTRYYLLRYPTIIEDSDISEEKLKIAYNADLANGLGNLVARVAKLCHDNDIESPHNGFIISEEVTLLIENYKFNEGLNYIWSLIAEADKLINLQKPWTLEGTELTDALKELVLRVKQIAHNLQPFMPETSQKIINQFSGKIKISPPLFPRL